MTISIDAAGRARACAEPSARPSRAAAAGQPAGAKGSQKLKHAAVALVVVDGINKNDPCLLITRRSPRLRSHAAQWALPGGRCDPGETPVETALRELDEELGLKISTDNALAVLDDYPTRSGYVVTPVVVWGGRIKQITPNPEEVQSVHRAPMTQLTDQARLEFLTIPESDRPVIRLRRLRITDPCADRRLPLPVPRTRRRPHHARRASGTAGLRLALSLSHARSHFSAQRRRSPPSRRRIR